MEAILTEIVLKPCPFCGSKAHFETLPSRPDMPGQTRYYVQCTSYLCQACVAGIDNDYDTPEAAARAWNCRVADKDLTQMTELWDRGRLEHKAYERAMRDVIKLFIEEVKHGD